MLYLRVVDRAKWKDRSPNDPLSVELASSNLAPKQGLSVFQVDNRDDAKRIALLYAITERAHRNTIDYLVFPDTLALGRGLTFKSSRGALHPILASKHHDVMGLENEDVRLKLAEDLLRALQQGTCEVNRLTQGMIRKEVPSLVAADPSLLDYKGQEWLREFASADAPGACQQTDREGAIQSEQAAIRPRGRRVAFIAVLALVLFSALWFLTC